MEFVHTSLSQQVAQQKASGTLPAAVAPNDGTSDEVAEADSSGNDISGTGTAYYEGQTDTDGSNVSGTSKKRVRHPKLPDKPLDFQVKKYYRW